MECCEKHRRVYFGDLTFETPPSRYQLIKAVIGAHTITAVEMRKLLARLSHATGEFMFVLDLSRVFWQCVRRKCVSGKSLTDDEEELRAVIIARASNMYNSYFVIKRPSALISKDCRLLRLEE